MKALIRDETEHGVEYVTLADAETAVEKTKAALEKARMYLEWIERVADGKRQWQIRSLAREGLTLSNIQDHPPQVG